MRTHNARNERIKRKYYTWLRAARGQSEATIDQVSASIDRFETYAKHADFSSFHVEKVKAFKAHLADQVSARTNERLSHATVYTTLNALRSFFEWLAGQPSYKQSFSFGDWEYFTPNRCDRQHSQSPAALTSTDVDRHSACDRFDAVQY